MASTTMPFSVVFLVTLFASCLLLPGANSASVTAREFDYVKGALSFTLPSWGLFFPLDDLAKDGDVYNVDSQQFKFTISLGSAAPVYHRACGFPWVLQMEVIAGGNLTECEECLNDLKGILKKWYKCNQDADELTAATLIGSSDLASSSVVAAVPTACAYSYLGYAQSTDSITYAFSSSCKGSAATCSVNEGEIISKSTAKGRNTFTFKAQNFDHTDLIICQFCDADCQVLKAFSSPVSFCKQPECSFYLCSETVRFVMCAYPWWTLLFVLVILLLFRWYIFAVLFFVIDLLRMVFRPRKPVMDEEEHVEFYMDDNGKIKETKRKKITKPRVYRSFLLAWLLGSSSTASALADSGSSNVSVNEVCAPPGGVVHLGQSGFTQVSNITTCTVANDQTECTVTMELLMDITPIAGICRSWTISSVKGMPVQSKTIHICVDSFEEIAPLTKLYETGTPSYTTSIAAACQGSQDPLCEPPKVGWITRSSASVGWTTGCFVFSSVPVCAMTSVDFTDHASVYTFGNLGQNLVLTAYVEDQNGNLTCPEKMMNRAMADEVTDDDGGGRTDDDEEGGAIVKAVSISGQFNSDDIKLPSGFKIIRKHASKSWHAGQAPDRFQTSGTVWGSFQFDNVAKKSSPAFPVASPIGLSGCTGPNGGWRCTVSAPGPGTENLRMMGVNDVFKSLGVTSVKDDGNPIIRHIPSSPSRFVISITTVPMTFTITKEEACPVFVSHNVEGGYIGNGTSSVIKITMKSSCNAGEVVFSVKGNCQLYNSPTFCYLWNSKESVCSVPVLFFKKVSSCTITAQGVTTETYTFQQTMVEDRSLYDQEYSNTTVVTNPNTGGNGSGISLPWWGILLIVVGCLLIVGVLVLVLYCCCCRGTSVTTVLSMMGGAEKSKKF